MKFAKSAAFTLLMAATLLPLTARAELSEKDMQVVGRALSFVVDGPKGDVPVAIVFQEGNASSEGDKAAAAKLLEAGLKTGELTLKGTPVPVSKIGDAGKYKVWYVTMGAGGAMGPAGGAAKAITVGTDKDCVAAGQCVIAVESSPKVQIYVSRAAAQAAGVSFSSAFLILVKEL